MRKTILAAVRILSLDPAALPYQSNVLPVLGSDPLGRRQAHGGRGRRRIPGMAARSRPFPRKPREGKENSCRSA